MKKILVVDDDKSVLQMFKDVLEPSGYKVFLAESGNEALTQYKKIKPHLVIMDVLMPKMDGVKTTKEILKLDKKAKIIVVTAVTKPGLEKNCVKAGASAFIMKPFEIDKLLSTIKNMVGGKR
ncbi:MAG: response regulator [Thermoplasmatales archaeon]|nr:response regulator [Thermoplasmatales archaeon]